MKFISKFLAFILFFPFYIPSYIIGASWEWIKTGYIDGKTHSFLD